MELNFSQTGTAQMCVFRGALEWFFAALVKRHAPLQEIKSLIKGLGHRGLLEDGLIKTSKGLTSIEEIMRVAYVEQDS
ncbi:hypothetical protein [Geopseudomonas aromaticivorans]